MPEQPSRPEIACLGRAPLAAAIVLMSALLAEIALAVAVDVPIRAGLALVTTLTLATAVLGLLCLGKCALHPALAAPLGVITLGARAWFASGLTGRIGGTVACVLMLFAAAFLGAALRRGLELARRPWTLAAAACGIQVAVYSIPPFGGAIRSGALAGLAFVVPVPEEGALAGWATAAETSAFGLDIIEAAFLAALVWWRSDGRSGSRRTVVAALSSALAVGLFTMGLGLRVPMLPFLVAGFYVMARTPAPAGRDDAPGVEEVDAEADVIG
ncbi:MAG: hypothetical protein ACYS9X_05110 [Planctomycetota bacterium]